MGIFKGENFIYFYTAADILEFLISSVLLSIFFVFWHRVILTKERPVIALSKREGKYLKMFMIVFGPIFLINLFYNAALSTLKPLVVLEASNSFIAYKIFHIQSQQATFKFPVLFL